MLYNERHRRARRVFIGRRDGGPEGADFRGGLAQHSTVTSTYYQYVVYSLCICLFGLDFTRVEAVFYI